MTIVVIPDIRDLGTVPNNGMEESVYSATAEAFTGQMPGWGADNKAVAEAGRTNALHAASAADSASSSAGTANGRAEAASASAATANTKAGEAADSATSAAASLAAMQKLYLGNKAAHPAVDNQGAALQKGAWYTNSTNSYWYWWNGANWIVGVGDLSAVDWATQVINKPPLVNSVNGRSGAVVDVLDSKVEVVYSKSSPMTAAPLWKWVAYTALDGANADWPTAAPVSFWIVFTKGVSEAGNDRFEQTAEQIYTQGGQGFTFKRVKHDGTWSRWKRVLTDDNIVESDAGGAISTSTFLLDPSVASVQHKSLSANTTISLPAARGAGDQATLYLYQGGSFSFAFASNIFLPVGVTLEAIPSGQMLPLYFFPKYAGSNQWCVAPGTRYQG